MPLDSESRWKLVRKLRARGEEQKRSSEVNIRAALVGDLVAVTEIYNYYIANSVVTFDIEAMTRTDWETKFHYIQGLGLPFIVAETDSHQIIGFAYVAPWRQKAAYRRTVEDSIYLRPAATGKRVGTNLLQALIDLCKAAGVKEIVAVISDRGAESSIALHERFGFKKQGHLGKVGFKFDRWLGVVLMQKSL